jgi:hypothetical protein
MVDALWSGRRFRTFNVLEDFNREALWIEIDTNLPARRSVTYVSGMKCYPSVGQLILLPSALLVSWREYKKEVRTFVAQRTAPTTTRRMNAPLESDQ